MVKHPDTAFIPNYLSIIARFGCLQIQQLATRVECFVQFFFYYVLLKLLRSLRAKESLLVNLFYSQIES